MTYNYRIRTILIATGVLAIVIIALLTWFYITTNTERSQQIVEITLDGVSRAELVDVSTGEVTQSLDSTGPMVLRYTTPRYEIRYSGSDGFSDGVTREFTPYQPVTEIRAAYDQPRLEQLHDQELSAIQAVIRQYAPNLSELYEPPTGALYERGDWFASILEYRGDALTDRDDVVIILHKQDDQWSIVSDPPQPSAVIVESAEIEVPLSVRSSINQHLLE